MQKSAEIEIISRLLGLHHSHTWLWLESQSEQIFFWFLGPWLCQSVAGTSFLMQARPKQWLYSFKNLMHTLFQMLCSMANLLNYYLTRAPARHQILWRWSWVLSCSVVKMSSCLSLDRDSLSPWASLSSSAGKLHILRDLSNPLALFLQGFEQPARSSMSISKPSQIAVDWKSLYQITYPRSFCHFGTCRYDCFSRKKTIWCHICHTLMYGIDNSCHCMAKISWPLATLC